MKNIWNSLNIIKEYVHYKIGDEYIVINTLTGGRVLMDEHEMSIFNLMIDNSQDDYDQIEKRINDTSSLNSLLIKLIKTNIFKLPRLQTKRETQYTHREAYFGMSEACNFRCVYCYGEFGTGANNKITSFLSYDEYIKIIDEVIDNKYNYIFFTGGEPLLNPYVFELGKYVKEKGVFCGILTNGSLINKENVQRLKVFDIVKISLDSCYEGTNDITRGKGTYNKIISAIQLLIENDINIGINTVLNKFNKDEMTRLMEFVAEDLNIKNHTIANHMPMGRGMDDNCGLDITELDYYGRVIFDYKKKNRLGNFSTVVVDDYFKYPNKKICSMADSEIFINYLGDVYPCRMTYQKEYFLGNMLKISLNQILQSAKEIVEKFNVDHLEGCKTCEIKSFCGGGCRMLHHAYTGDINCLSNEVCHMMKEQMRMLVCSEFDKDH